MFSATPYLGNPVAVVLAANGLTTAQMAAFARWTNLSETTFVLAPQDARADYRVRIFTAAAAGAPDAELPFAGHPTLGTCHAWLAAGGTPRDPAAIVQECGAGLVPIRRDGERLAFAAPPLRREGPAGEPLVERLAAMLGIARGRILDAAWADNGPGSPHAFEVRAFIPAAGEQTVEDPVTGSLNAAVAQWLLQSGRATAPYVASQGTALHREGRVHISRDADATIWVAGATVTCVAGTVKL